MRPFLTRRDFLHRAALTSAVLAAARPAVAADGLPAQAGGSMFVSLNGSVTRGVSGFDKARLAAKVGYGGVDWDLGPAKTAGLDATKSLFNELKIKPSVTGFPMARPLPFGGEQAAFQQALGPLAEDAAFAAGIGCQKMMVVLSPTGPLPKEEQRKVVRDRLAAISEVLQQSNLRLGVEFLGVRSYVGTEAFEATYWRAPFLLSAVRLGISVWIRLQLDESPLAGPAAPAAHGPRPARGPRAAAR